MKRMPHSEVAVTYLTINELVKALINAIQDIKNNKQSQLQCQINRIHYSANIAISCCCKKKILASSSVLGGSVYSADLNNF